MIIKPGMFDDLDELIEAAASSGDDEILKAAQKKFDEARETLGALTQTKPKKKRPQRKAAGAKKKPRKPPVFKEEPQHLPAWPDEMRAMPNHLTRCSLFAAIRPGRRKMMDKVKLASRNDVTLFFTGKKLDQADADVWMQALQLAKHGLLEDRVYINRAEFLRLIGRNGYGRWYDWLHESLRRLSVAFVDIETKRYKMGFNLINDYGLDNETGEYWLTINAKARSLFSGQEYGLIDWNIRKRIRRGQHLAKWLQNYIISHEVGKQHTIDIKLLKAWSGADGRLRDFRNRALPNAFTELEKLGVIKKSQIRPDGKVSWIRLV